MSKHVLTIFYDGACPSCIKDRDWFERRLGKQSNVRWCDITGKEDYLKSIGIDPYWAVKELHVQHENGFIYKELDAYILLLKQVWYLRPLAWLMSIPLIKKRLSRRYRKAVDLRLEQQGRTSKR
ncbi:thiol-disulfide oxidoreductase DCC family protein [Photobacterium minamisatsumaniensis]|uniref:thiol-disulfide oxidoreductase DCC family protein n=1 Tax=Photobacterium minamisatsumaniensis TaxID=2910233 RepID=UPI003D0D67CB